MSNFRRSAYHPKSGKIKAAWWMDDYFGRWQYAVLFDDDEHPYHPEEVEIPINEVFVRETQQKETKGRSSVGLV